jgi:uncharacterized protein (TIRG00374 family)
VKKYLRLTASVALLGLLAWMTDWPRLAEQLSRADWRLWALTVGIYLVAQVLSALRWRLLAQPLGLQGTLGRFTAIYFIGMYFNLFLPTSVGGDVLRAWYVDQGGGRKVEALLSVFVDRLNGFLVLLGIACVAAIFSPGVRVGLCGYEVPLAWLAWFLGASAVLGLAGVVLVSRLPLALNRLPLVGARMTGLARQLTTAIDLYLRHPRLLLATTLLSLGVQAANVILVWLTGVALGVPVPFAYYWVVVPLLSVASMLPSMNGLGVREGAMVLMLTPVGVSQTAALGLAYLGRITMTAASLAGLVCYVRGGFPPPGRGELAKEQGDAEPVGGDPGQGRAGQPAAAA